MHLDVMQRILLKRLHVVFPTTLMEFGIIFFILQIRRVWLCGAETVRGRARTQAWKGRLRDSHATTL